MHVETRKRETERRQTERKIEKERQIYIYIKRKRDYVK